MIISLHHSNEAARNLSKGLEILINRSHPQLERWIPKEEEIELLSTHNGGLALQACANHHGIALFFKDNFYNVRGGYRGIYRGEKERMELCAAPVSGLLIKNYSNSWKSSHYLGRHFLLFGSLSLSFSLPLSRASFALLPSFFKPKSSQHWFNELLIKLPVNQSNAFPLSCAVCSELCFWFDFSQAIEYHGNTNTNKQSKLSKSVFCCAYMREERCIAKNNKSHLHKFLLSLTSLAERFATCFLNFQMLRNSCVNRVVKFYVSWKI